MLSITEIFKSRLSIFLLTLITVIVFWITDALIDSLLYDNSFLNVLLFDKDEVIFRIFFSIAFFAFGFIMSHVISLKNKSEKAIQKSEERFSALINSTDDSICLIDRKYRYLFLNDTHLKRLGIKRDESIKQPFSRFHSKEATSTFIDRVDAVLNTGKSAQYEYNSRKDGKYFLQTFSPVMEPDNNIFAVSVISKDISTLKEMEEELRTLLMTDELTSIYNRRGFFTMAGHNLNIASRLGRSVYLLSADLDNLKEINDNLGHHEGDRALSEAADALKAIFRESDVVARLGGDEFAVLHIGNKDIKEDVLADRLKKKIIEINMDNKRLYNLSMSIGIVKVNSRTTHSLSYLMLRADKEMYKIKKLKQKRSVLKSA